MRYVVLVALLAVVASPPSETPFSCTTVRAMVKLLGEAEAETLAKKAGWTSRQIEVAKRCIKALHS